MKILLVSWVAPFPATAGGSQRTNLLYRALSECGEVDLVALTSPSRFTSQEMDVMRSSFGLKVCLPIPKPKERGVWRFVPLPPRLRNRLAHCLDGSRSLFQPKLALRQQVSERVDFSAYDLIVGRYAKSIAALGLQNDKSLRIALDVDDWDPDRYLSRMDADASALQRLIFKWHLSNLRKALPQFLEQMDTLWVANPDNLQSPLLAGARLLRNIPYPGMTADQAVLPAPTAGEVVITIGSYLHRPNVQGIDWFLRRVWPRVLAERPAATFRIYGSWLSDGMRKRWSKVPGVEVVGFVETIEDAYRDAVVSVCAVQAGAGTNIKILEAYRFGRPCVTTTSGARGFQDLTQADVLSVAGTAEDMVQHIVDLLKRRAEAKRKGELGHQIVGQTYSYAGFAKAVREGVCDAVNARRGGDDAKDGYVGLLTVPTR